MPNPPSRPARPPRYLAKCAAIALWGFSLMLFLMQLPWIAVKINPGSLEAGMESLETQTLVTFTPLFFTLAAMVTALFFAAVQNKFLAAAAVARGMSVSKTELRKLLCPFLRQKEIKRLLGEQPLLKASGLCMLFFWGLYLVLGLTSPIPPYFLLAGMVLFFSAARGLTEEKLSAILRFWGLGLTVLFLLSSSDSIAVLRAARKKDVPALIPRSRGELKALIYQKNTPDAVYSRMAKDSQKPAVKKLLADLLEAQHIHTAPAEWKKKADLALKNPALHAFFKELTQKLDAGENISLDLNLDAARLWHAGGDWFFSRIAGAYYSSLVFEAIEKKDKQAMMKNFRRLHTLCEGVQRGDFIISLSYCFLIELNRSSTVGAMIGSGLLSLEDIRELQRLNSGREKKFKAALLTALRGEAAFERELIRDMAQIYSWLQSAETQGEELYENAFLKFLLRGDIGLPPLIWHRAMTQHIQNISSQKFDMLLKSLEKNPSYPEWKKTLPELEKFLAANGSYFVMLNYKATLTSIAQLHHAVSCVRLTDLALEIEKFRLTRGRMPKDLRELKIPLPRDAVSGEPLHLKNRIELPLLQNDNKKKRLILKGWQVHGTAKEHIKLSVPASLKK